MTATRQAMMTTVSPGFDYCYATRRLDYRYTALRPGLNECKEAEGVVVGERLRQTV